MQRRRPARAATLFEISRSRAVREAGSATVSVKVT
jgi:hypothetical protein